MKYVDCTTQGELDAALREAGAVPRCIGAGWFEAWESAHVVAWGSAHVVARGSAHVVAWESAHVVATKFVAVTKQRHHVGTIRGGTVIKILAIKTAADWCEFYGASVKRGVATLYKALDDGYKSGRGFAYVPGTKPAAPDWDGGKAECGGGLHFCAHPLDALGFMTEAVRFVACPVRLKDIAVHANAEYPNKVKAPRCCGPVYEVDRYGQRLPQPDDKAVA
jgi:hypothetical protein